MKTTFLFSSTDTAVGCTLYSTQYSLVNPTNYIKEKYPRSKLFWIELLNIFKIGFITQEILDQGMKIYFAYIYFEV